MCLPASAHAAREQYEAVSYNEKDGVSAYYSAIMDAKDQLFQEPAEIELARKFAYGLPSGMLERMAERHSIEVEVSPLQTIYDAARQVELALRMAKHATQAQRKATQTVAAAPRTKYEQPKPAHYRFVPNPKYAGSSGAANGGVEKRTVSDNQPKIVAEQRTQQGMTAVKDTRNERHNHTHDRSKGTKSVTCYECGEVGHISPNCPNKGQKTARMNAWRLVDDRSDTEDEKPEIDELKEMADTGGENGVGESEEPQYLLAPYDSYVYPDDSDEENTTPVLRMNAARVTTEEGPETLARARMYRTQPRPDYDTDTYRCI